jgi:hypothetical protein
VNVEQTKSFGNGLISLANLLLSVTLITPVFGGSGPLSLPPGEVMALGVVVALVLYAQALNILSKVK